MAHREGGVRDLFVMPFGQVQEYRRKVYRIISDVIGTDGALESPAKITWEHPLWSIFMGVEHEAIHLETSSVLFRETPCHLMQVPKVWPKRLGAFEMPRF